jgi:hypothetical protein
MHSKPDGNKSPVFSENPDCLNIAVKVHQLSAQNSAQDTSTTSFLLNMKSILCPVILDSAKETPERVRAKPVHP